MKNFIILFLFILFYNIASSQTFFRYYLNNQSGSIQNAIYQDSYLEYNVGYCFNQALSANCSGISINSVLNFSRFNHDYNTVIGSMGTFNSTSGFITNIFQINSTYFSFVYNIYSGVNCSGNITFANITTLLNVNGTVFGSNIGCGLTMRTQFFYIPDLSMNLTSSDIPTLSSPTSSTSLIAALTSSISGVFIIICVICCYLPCILLFILTIIFLILIAMIVIISIIVIILIILVGSISGVIYKIKKPHKIEDFSFKDYQIGQFRMIPNKYIKKIGNKLGSGAYGMVELVTIFEENYASKSLFDNTDELFTEALMLSNIPLSPNLIKFYGLSENNEIITEYFNAGNLQNFIKNNYLSYDEIRDIAKQILTGLKALHKVNIIHRDLSCRNLLIEKNGSIIRIAITDFGFSRQLMEKMEKSTTVNTTLPIRWSASESIKENVYSSASDIFSFGRTLYEIITKDVPFANEDINKVIQYVAEGINPIIPDNIPDDLRTIINHCCQFEPEKRPSVSDLLKFMEMDSSNYQSCEFLDNGFVNREIIHNYIDSSEI